MSVLRKLERGQEAQAELAIRYWHPNSCFQQFTLIKIASCQSYRAAWTLEHLLISQWQPKLNYPYAQVFLKRTAVGSRPARQQRFSSFLVSGFGSGGSCVRDSFTVFSLLNVQFRDVKHGRFCMISQVSHVPALMLSSLSSYFEVSDWWMMKCMPLFA